MNASDRAALRIAFALCAVSGMWTMAMATVIRPQVLFALVMAASIAIAYVVIVNA